MELNHSKKKQKKTEDPSISAAAATLASFTQSSDEDIVIRQHYRKNKKSNKQQQQQQQQDDGCGDHEDCSGNGKYVCEQCGLTYQHGICLQRHAWDHTEGWTHRRWGMSKRQQVQILEAAQILMDIAKGMRVSVLN
ncbi:uncharacterized protein BX664DRAFT_327973 [Halteromyces radiatus]|uniref:uncharacterized protein n=1 Tax=Halteromyces radiatus TaxID=101107 RepID=UPI00222022F7|nr:uncharacterized protein BX664DRAFT_327973 [Halteromyces radiatus]KAI8092720.1 hypothetical protein BX664DRAFT_327973 [Halteromyces radiatus]